MTQTRFELKQRMRDQRVLYFRYLENCVRLSVRILQRTSALEPWDRGHGNRRKEVDGGEYCVTDAIGHTNIK